jgi:hypothetical protein
MATVLLLSAWLLAEVKGTESPLRGYLLNGLGAASALSALSCWKGVVGFEQAAVVKM